MSQGIPVQHNQALVIRSRSRPQATVLGLSGDGGQAMAQGTGVSRGRALPPARRDDHFVFDMKNGLRVWLGEALKRGEVTAKDAQDAIRRIDAGKATDEAEDKLKLALGPIKDSFGMVKLGKKLVTDFNRWWNVTVEFKPGPKGDLVHIKGWPNGRKLLSGTRYRVDNVKIMEMQIGKPGIQTAAKDSARFGLILVVAVDFIQFARDHNLAHLLASLTIDLPSVALASFVGGLVGSAVVGSTLPGIALIGAVALGPALVAFAVGVGIGVGLWWLDRQFHLNERLTKAYEDGLSRLQHWWDQVGRDAHREWLAFTNSGMVHDLRNNINQIEDFWESGVLTFDRSRL